MVSDWPDLTAAVRRSSFITGQSCFRTGLGATSPAHNPYTIDPAKIKDIEIVRTVVGGKVAYQA